MNEKTKENIEDTFKKVSKIIEKDYIVISKSDFEEIYKLINSIDFDEDRIIGILEYIHYILSGLYYNIKYSKLKKWILKYILRIDLEKILKEVNKNLSEIQRSYLGIYHMKDMDELKEKLENIKKENYNE